MDTSTLITLRGVRVPALVERAQACSHPEAHGDCLSSCCFSESKTKSKSVKEILSKNNSIFRTNCPHSTKRTGHYAWAPCLFSWSGCNCNHPLFCRTCCSLSPCHHGMEDRGMDCLDGNSQVDDRCNHIGLALMTVGILVVTMLLVFDSWLCTVGRWAVLFSFDCFLSLAIFSRTPAALSVAWHCSKKVMTLSGSVGTVLFKSANLNWCTLGCTKKICSLLSCAMGTSIVWWR